MYRSHVQRQIYKQIKEEYARNTRLFGRRRLQRPNHDIILLPSSLPVLRTSVRRGDTVFVSNADEVSTVPAEQFGPPSQKTPNMSRFEVGSTAELLHHEEAALFHRYERDDPLLDGLPIFGANIGHVPVGGAQV